MLTELNCKSATHVKNAVVFYYIHVILHILLAIAMCTCGLFVVFVILKLRCLNYLKSLTSQFSTFVKNIWLEENCALQLPGQVV